MRSPTLLLSALSALIAGAQPVIEVTPLDIRPGGEDYAPCFLDSGFVMSSVREASAAIGYTDAKSGKALSDLYWVPMKDGKAGIPALFSTTLTTPVNEGPAAFSSDGRTICYTRNLVIPKNASSNKAGNAQLGLFFSDLVNGVWTEAIPFQHNSGKYSMMHPAFSASGDTLYFASDMPGGLGGLDIYFSVLTRNEWSAPTNAGPELNTSYNEAYPSIRNRVMHFSSDRPGGQGRADIHTSIGNGTSWTSPKALPPPINGPSNDHGHVPTNDPMVYLMSSDRSGTDRIYRVTYTIERFQECSEQQLNNYCYVFKGKAHPATSSLPLDHVWDLGDGTRISGNRAEHCYNGPGTYTVRSLLVDRKTGATFHTLQSNEVHVTQWEQAFISAPDTIRTGRRLVFDPRHSHVPGMTPKEYHWDLGDGNVAMGELMMHQYRNAGTYTVKLNILGKPDQYGNIPSQCNTRMVVVLDKYRENEDMAVTVVYQDAFGQTRSYELQELPFDEMMIEGLAINDAKFAVELFKSKERVSLDSPTFMEISKFYRVVERFDPVANVYIYTVGDADNMEQLYQVYKKVRELDFMDAEVFQIAQEKLMDMSSLGLAGLRDLKNKKLSVNSIPFAFKSAELEPGSEEILDEVVKLLQQHPTLQIVIEAHTDDVGSFAYNMDLSDRRAASVQAYLVERQVDPSRLKSIGHGKNQPIASNKTESGRSRNRRVEFRMVVVEDAKSLSSMP